MSWEVTSLSNEGTRATNAACYRSRHIKKIKCHALGKAIASKQTASYQGVLCHKAYACSRHVKNVTAIEC